MMDKYTEYLLDQIENFRNDARIEPSEKTECEYAIGALLGALIEYHKSLKA